MPRYLFQKILLNDGPPSGGISLQEMAAQLKRSMDRLKAAFFETGTGRVAYERIKESAEYQAHLELSNNLQAMDLGLLARREDKIAFWINLYNVIVIHGVIALGIRDSVKEVWNFFRGVYYQVGGYHFCPDDIEHGILRGNRRPPYSLFRRFGATDPRLNFMVSPLDPRIHFILVCGSASCPFIDVYNPETLEEELEIAARAFVNSGGVVLDRGHDKISLSSIFKWYADDFGKDQSARLRFLARYLDRAEDRAFIVQNAYSLKTTYQPYDWRLNQY
ncbi:MAG: DUF547 domain-containing protein [Syntrophales bacterium]|nr:DUF547 domain-containing protein [Syntrophales bacterium]MDD5642044.1 DUF547 domain-containing protein [Syntrophales bacterium]